MSASADLALRLIVAMVLAVAGTAKLVSGADPAQVLPAGGWTGLPWTLAAVPGALLLILVGIRGPHRGPGFQPVAAPLELGAGSSTAAVRRGIALVGLDGGSTSFGALVAGSDPTSVVLADPGCWSCRTLMAQLAGSNTTSARGARVVVSGLRSPDDAFLAGLPLSGSRSTPRDLPWWRTA